jgi:hypothetical protein
MSKNLATAPIKPLFAPTGWKTVALEHISFQVPDYRKEAPFYIALMKIAEPQSPMSRTACLPSSLRSFQPIRRES